MISTQVDATNKTKIGLGLGLITFITAFYLTVLDNEQLYLVLVIALPVLIFDLVWFNKLIDRFLIKRESSQSFHTSLLNHLEDSLKSNVLFVLLKHELTVLFYAFFAQHSKSYKANKSESISYEKSANASDMFWVVALAQLPTLPFIHVLLDNIGSPVGAWCVTLVTLWSVVYFRSQVFAVRLRPLRLSATHLHYRFGLAVSAEIPLKNINKVKKVDYQDKYDHFSHFVSPLGSDKNILLEFSESMTFNGRYLTSIQRDKAVISVDDPESFIKQLSELMNGT